MKKLICNIWTKLIRETILLVTVITLTVKCNCDIYDVVKIKIEDNRKCKELEAKGYNVR